MNVETMRSEIMNEYPGIRWKQRVLGMPDHQIFAIYKRINVTKTGKRRVKRAKQNPKEEQLRFDI